MKFFENAVALFAFVLYSADMDQTNQHSYLKLLQSIVSDENAKRVGEKILQDRDRLLEYAAETMASVNTIRQIGKSSDVSSFELMLKPTPSVKSNDSHERIAAKLDQAAKIMAAHPKVFDTCWLLARVTELIGETDRSDYCACCYRDISREPGSHGQYCSLHAHTRLKPNYSAYAQGLKSLPSFQAELERRMALDSSSLKQLEQAKIMVDQIAVQVETLKNLPALIGSTIVQEIARTISARIEMLSSEFATIRSEEACLSQERKWMPEDQAWKLTETYLRNHYEAAKEGKDSIKYVVSGMLKKEACPSCLRLADGVSAIRFANLAPEKHDHPSTTSFVIRWREANDDIGSLDHHKNHTITPLTMFRQWIRFAAWKEAGDQVDSTTEFSGKRGRPARIDAEIAMVLLKEGLSVAEIAQHFSVSQVAVYRHFGRRGIDLNNRNRGDTAGN